ncbi:MAG: hypothetical protein HXY49_10145 [Ignavibacteriaceae bacterium]|nr:hypothetical protein [Ignavibacteriaceae bacterium]
MDINKLAFLDTFKISDGSGLMGAILVTDSDTKPIEFRVTAPIRPTNFQKTLYGDVLLEHILVELISLPLLNAINQEIDLIIVKDPFFLGANNKQGVRIIRVFNEEDGQHKSSQVCEKFLSNGNGKGKIFVSTLKKFESELESIVEKLLPLTENRYLLEPFERLKLACEQVHLQKTNE